MPLVGTAVYPRCLFGREGIEEGCMRDPDRRCRGDGGWWLGCLPVMLDRGQGWGLDGRQEKRVPTLAPVKCRWCPLSPCEVHERVVTPHA